MNSFTLFGDFPVEIQDQIWQAAAVSAHSGPRVLHLGLFGVDIDDNDNNILLLVPEASTVNETRHIRALSKACHQSRRWARAYLPDTLYLQPGELWFRDGEDIISFIGAADGLKGPFGFPRLNVSRWVPMVSIWRIRFQPEYSCFPAQDLSVRRLGVDMNDHIRRGLATIQQQRLDDLPDDSLLHLVLRHAIMAFYALKLLYPNADIYAVWEEKDVPGFCSNAEAVPILQHLWSSYVDSINVSLSSAQIMQQFRAQAPERLRHLARIFLELEVGSAVFSGNEDSEDTRIVDIQRPTPL
ncbi:hypothetical protein SLS64_000760 [Diaporthe eres]|uniref:2EXR domain-containing protein n=1 Tax=Diaporthe eres TaxID=83184 RepID=A0ABR1P5A2_DIAER